jgi:Staphylococcal nuclease homologue
MAVRKVETRDVLTGLAVVAFFNPPDWGVTSGEFEYVQRVVDGDTIVLGTGERVRLIGVDTPESVRPNTPVQRFSAEAADFTRRMVEGKRVRLAYNQANAAQGHKDNTQQKRKSHGVSSFSVRWVYSCCGAGFPGRTAKFVGR